MKRLTMLRTGNASFAQSMTLFAIYAKVMELALIAYLPNILWLTVDSAYYAHLSILVVKNVPAMRSVSSAKRHISPNKGTASAAAALILAAFFAIK